MKTTNTPLDTLRHHVTGAIERGESSPIIEVPAVSPYDQQAETFLTKNGIKFRATLSDSKTPAWKEDGELCGHHYRVTLSKDKRSQFEALFQYPDRTKETSLGLFTSAKQAHAANDSTRDSLQLDYASKCGWRVEERIERNADKLTFDFWNSIADCQCRQCKGKKTIKLDKPEPIQVPNPMAGQKFNMGTDRRPMEYTYPATLAGWKRDTQCPRCNGTGVDPEPIHPSAYSVLACISSDAYCPDTFADFCADYGYETDSIKALQTFRRCSAFAKRLRAFFTEQELQELSEIN